MKYSGVIISTGLKFYALLAFFMFGACLANARLNSEAFNESKFVYIGEASMVKNIPIRTSPRIVDTIFVATPTGNRETDRRSILAALEKVEPGGIIQFAPGTYRVGETISVTKSSITLLGHPEGTIIRGCEPAEFDDKDFAVSGCNGFSLTAGQQTVRNLSFEYTWHALILGGQPCEKADCPPGTLPVPLRTGGYLVEDNTFRVSQNGIRVVGQWNEPAVICNNNFINTYHAVVINGMTAHIINNDISVPEPFQIPNTYHPGLALMIGGWEERGVPHCNDNIIAGNTIKGHPDAIAIMVFEGGICRQNTIRDNTIVMSKVHFDSSSTAIYNRNIAETSISGIPLALLNDIGFGKGVIEDNLIKKNYIFGAEGLAIEVTGASDNQIVENTIHNVSSRNSFPGNTLLPKVMDWSAGNGSGIWLSPGSNGNEILDNTFEDIASYEVFIEGDSTKVELKSIDKKVQDLGFMNQIQFKNVKSPENIKSDMIKKWSDPSPHDIRFVTVAPAVQLEVLDWGGEGLPLIFLAGLQMNAHAFDDLAPRFTDTHRVVGITRRGHGASNWPENGYSLDRLAEDILIVLDTLGMERVVLAGHSLAGSEITKFASKFPNRVAGLVYIDAGHDLTLIERHRLMAVCPAGPEVLVAIERLFKNPEAFRYTQKQEAPDGAWKPFVSDIAVSRIYAGLVTPDYSGVSAPALALYDTPRRIEDVFGGETTLSSACISAMQRYIYEGIAGFAAGMAKARIVAFDDSNHNLHLVSPDALEKVMRRWLSELPE